MTTRFRSTCIWFSAAAILAFAATRAETASALTPAQAAALRAQMDARTSASISNILKRIADSRAAAISNLK